MTITTRCGHSLLFSVFILAFASVGAADFLDEDIVALHSNFMTPDQLKGLKRQLRGLQGYGGGRGSGGGYGGGGGGGPGFKGDEHATIQTLVQNHKKIRRVVQHNKAGYVANTTSKDPDVAKAIQKHVIQMVKLVDEGRKVRLRDPLYEELFRNVDSITIEARKIKKGVQVSEQGDNACAVAVAKKHANVVSKFAKKGRPAVWANYNVPKQCKK